MTLTETFHFVAERLLKQGCRSQRILGNPSTCLYRDEHGNKCAAGFLITDEEYEKEMETSNIQHVENEFKLKNITRENIDLVRELQKLHDGVCQYENVKIGDWPEHLYNIAYQFGITPKLQQWL